MKKIFTVFAALVFAANMFAGFGVLVNNKMYYEGAALSEKDYQGRDQFKASVSLNAGDIWCIYDDVNKAKFTIAIEAGEGSAKDSFAEGAESATCNVAGCYDFYIKLKWEDNSLWVQNGADCSATGVEIDDDPIVPPVGPGDDEDVNYYAIGWINGADHGEGAYDVFDDNYLFVDGKLTIDCQMGSYIAVKDHLGNYYYFRGNDNCHESQVTLEWANGWAPCQKWALIEGTHYIIMRSATCKGNIVLESVDKATYDAYHWGSGSSEGIENTVVNEKAHKVFVDGQLRIVRGSKVFDATGREL